MSDLGLSNAELNRKLSELTVEHIQGRCKPEINQNQLNECSPDFLNRLKEYQEEQLLANKLQEAAIKMNLRRIESAIATKVPPLRCRSRSKPRTDESPCNVYLLPNLSTRVFNECTAASSTISHSPCFVAQSRGESLRLNREMLPMNRLNPDQVPPGSTIVVQNFASNFREPEVVNLLNTLNGKFSEWCTALVAVHILYHQHLEGITWRSGKVYAMYASPGLAELAVSTLNLLHIMDHRLRVCISNQQIDFRNAVAGQVQVGKPRYGDDIFNYPAVW